MRSEGKTNRQWGVQTDSSETEEEAKGSEPSSSSDCDGGSLESENRANADDGSELRDKEMHYEFANDLIGHNVKMGLDFLPLSRNMSAEYEKEPSISGILKWPN